MLPYTYNHVLLAQIVRYFDRCQDEEAAAEARGIVTEVLGVA
jgi:hypothetical protein